MCRIIFHFTRFYYVEMRRKLWPKAPAKESALGQMSKNFQVHFVHINVFNKPNKKIYNKAKNTKLFDFFVSDEPLLRNPAYYQPIYFSRSCIHVQFLDTKIVSNKFFFFNFKTLFMIPNNFYYITVCSEKIPKNSLFSERLK